MTFPVAAALSVLAVLPVADVEPRPALRLAGAIQFARPQEMTLTTSPRDGTRLTVRMGFDGPCTGGGIGEVWVARVAARPALRARGGSFDAALTGASRNLGGVRGRTGEFRWRLTGRFVERDVAVATVTGSAEIKVGRRVVSRCRIATPASVRLARR